MHTRLRAATVLSAIVFTMCAFTAPTGEAATRDRIERRLKRLGVAEYTLDLNVRIPVPEINGAQAVDLWATVICPDALQPRPTILIATPYRRENFLMLADGLLLHGYNVMSLDVRGTGSSGGQWVSFGIEEQNDTAYVIDEWIPAQPWSDGAVGMIGPSYCGIIQLLTAGRVQVDNETGQPLHLKAIVASVAMSDAYRDIVMQGGNLDLGFIPLWIDSISDLSVEQPLLSEEPGFSTDSALQQEAAEIVQVHAENIPVARSWITDPDHAVDGPFYDMRSPMRYWPEKPATGRDVPGGDGTIPESLPILLSGGWFDIFTRGTLNNYHYGLARHASADKALIVGPWYHYDGALLSGITAFGSCALQARWFDWKIKGSGSSFLEEFPVLLYVMGAEQWRAEKAWPLPDSRLSEKTLYLSPSRAASLDADWFSFFNRPWNYQLVEQTSAGDFSGDHPVLEHNPLLLHGEHSRASIRWGGCMMNTPQSKRIDDRRDEIGVLTFTTAPLDADMEIAGPLLLTFWARTEFHLPLTRDAVEQTIDLIKRVTGVDESLILDSMTSQDVQWVAELHDVSPGGRAKNSTSGWLSAWHRPCDPADNGTERSIDPDYVPFDPFYSLPDLEPDPIEQGVLYHYALELWPTDTVFPAGHRLRVSLSASDYPHLLPVLIPSRSTLVIDDDHPAQLDFHVVNNAGEGIDWKWVDDVNAYLLSEN